MPAVLTFRQSVEDVWETLLRTAPFHMLDQIAQDEKSAPWVRRAAAVERENHNDVNGSEAR